MRASLTGLRLQQILKHEFHGYNFKKFRQDLIAGVTVAAVSLPLALAFGVASGVTAAAGLVTAIIAGFVIGGLGGAPYQISGPSGAMAAVLIVVASRYGLPGVWTATLLAGVFIFVMGLFRLGQIVNFIPTSVIAGFNSGIAIIIFVGQIDNLLGVNTGPSENALVKLFAYGNLTVTPNWAAVGLGALVIVLMALWPERLNARFPDSLLALVVAGTLSIALGLDVPTIGSIPQSILLADRLRPDLIPWEHVGALVGPALSIAALGSVEGLLCGAAAGRATGIRMDNVQQLLGQGIGNIVIPWFGGVPATAAIARSNVAIRGGSTTRMTSILHSVVLLLAALLLGPIIARVPLAALGGVLAVTAWRTNEWNEIRGIFRHRFRADIAIFLSTMIATVALDLTQAIIVGLGLSALIFVFQSTNTEVLYSRVSVEKMREAGYELKWDGNRILVVYIVGPLFFGTVSTFNAVFANINGDEDIILSLRTVPLLDTTGISAIEDLLEKLESDGRRLYLSGLARPVRSALERAGVLQRLGEDRIFWSADQAIMAADRYRAAQAASQAANQTAGQGANQTDGQRANQTAGQGAIQPTPNN